MGQVAITLNDRTYRLVCDDGEEDHLVTLAQIVKAKIDTLRADVGHVGDERLMLMAALLIADELVAERALAAHHRQGEADTLGASPAYDHSSADLEAAQLLRTAAAKMAAGPNAGVGASTANTTAGPVSSNPLSRSRRRDVA
jgi:cell division protein ZapA